MAKVFADDVVVSTACSPDPVGPQTRKTKPPLFIVMGFTSTVCFVGICLSVFLVTRYYGRESVKDLQLVLRQRFPLEVQKQLILKLDVVPKFMETTMNHIEGSRLDLQSWEGTTQLVDVMVSYLITFPAESRCCSGFLVLSKDVNYSSVIVGSPMNPWSFVSVCLLRPGGTGIQWWHNDSTSQNLIVNAFNRTSREAQELVRMPLTAVDPSPWFSRSAYPVDQDAGYTNAVVWPLDDYQLKVHSTLPLWKGGRWIGTYVGGFKLGFLGSFLREIVAARVGWTLFLVDTGAANTGLLLASSIPRLPVMTCVNAYRCDPAHPDFKNEFSPCVPCETSVLPSMIRATEAADPRVREAALKVEDTSGTDWIPLLGDTRVDTEKTIEGVRYLLSTTPIETRGLGWVAVLLVPRSDVFGKLDEGERIGTALSASLIATGVFLFVCLSFIISRPISRLSKKLLRVSDLQLEDKEGPSGAQGIGVIAKFVSEFGIFEESFGYMIEGLREYRAYVPTALLKSEQERDPPEGEVSVVFTDIVGSTALWSKDALSMNQALEFHNDAIRLMVLQHGGYEVKTIGDAFMVAFDDPSAACRFCIKTQLVLSAQEWPPELELLPTGLRVRMGCAHGHVTLEENPLTGRADYRGPTVNCAARLESKARSGTLCLDSLLVRTHPEVLSGLNGDYQVETKSHGKHELKGIGTVECLLVAPTELKDRLDEEVVPMVIMPLKSPTGTEHSRVSSFVSGKSGTSGNPHAPSRKTNLSLAMGTATIACLRVIKQEDVFDLCSHVIRVAHESAREAEGVVAGLFGKLVVVTWNTSKLCRSHVQASFHFAISVHRRFSDVLTLGLATGQVLYGNVGTSRLRFNAVFGQPLDAAAAAAELAAVLKTFVIYAECVVAGRVPVFPPNLPGCLRIVDIWRASGSAHIHLYEPILPLYLRHHAEDGWDESIDEEDVSTNFCCSETDVKEHNEAVMAHLNGQKGPINDLQARAGDSVQKNIIELVCMNVASQNCVAFSCLPHGVPALNVAGVQQKE